MSSLSMTDTLGSYTLSAPRLQFDYENRRAVSEQAYRGLCDLGPADASERRRSGKKRARALLVGRSDRRRDMDRVERAILGKRLGKFHDAFEIEIAGRIDVQLARTAAADDEAGAYRSTISGWLLDSPYRPDVDIAFVLHGPREQYRGDSPYFASKAAFLSNAILTQNIAYPSVESADFERYYLANILTASYAKLGGTPWVVQAGSAERPQVTVGVATTAVHTQDYVQPLIAVCTIFKENGAFALWDVTAPEADLAKYERQLEQSIVRAISTFEDREGRHVSRVACHVSGTGVGGREIEATRKALAAFPGRSIVADLVHISDDAPLWLFDGSTPSQRPRAGVLAKLARDGSTALLHADGEGPGGSSHYLMRPLKLSVRSEQRSNGCRDIYQHLYELRWMNWRSVRPSSRPDSVTYPNRMAYLLGYLYEHEHVKALDILPKLRSLPWFL
jgi:hypothetical protein